jgi:hypothetical protein
VKIHIATTRELHKRACRLATRLRKAGHRVVSRWIDGRGQRATLADNALYTLADIVVADCTLLIDEGGKRHRSRRRTPDRHVELGYALRAGKRLCVLGRRETPFAYLPSVEHYGTVKELLHGLR